MLRSTRIASRAFAEAAPKLEHTTILMRVDGEILFSDSGPGAAKALLRPDSLLLHYITNHLQGFDWVTRDGVEHADAFRKIGS